MRNFKRERFYEECLISKQKMHTFTSVATRGLAPLSLVIVSGTTLGSQDLNSGAGHGTAAAQELSKNS